MKTHRLLLLTATALSLAACGYASPDAGQEGVAIAKPWFFGSGGVRPDPIATGSSIVAASTDVVMVDMTPQAFEVQFDNLMPSNRIPVDFHTVVRVQVVDSVDLVKNWRGAMTRTTRNDEEVPADLWFWGSIQPIYVNLVREEVKRYDMNALVVGNGVAEIEAAVTNKLNNYLRVNKMPVRLLSVTMGKANIPESILNQTTATANQEQRKLTMDATAAAETARINAERQRAMADNAYRVDVGRSPEQELEFQRIKMLGEACQTNTCVFGNPPLMMTR